MSAGSGAADDILTAGGLEVIGRIPWSSNATFLARLHRGDEVVPAIYKPRRGERPLWDFPRGTLCRREVAARLVSEALGWGIVPATVLRDGPFGEGMVQRFVEHDPDQHFFTLRLASTAGGPGESFGAQLRRFALFDVVINNADRKAGHCLRDGADHIWGIDHGLSFHGEPKLRTVIWDYEGEPIAAPDAADLARLARLIDAGLRRSPGDPLGDRLRPLLSPAELAALSARLGWLLAGGVFPAPVTDHPYPWPMV